ncbi:MAG: YbbR-like domain-containing protein [Prevotellaceae bacterium]|nr:YbbR-like domain-containing protein [Prevotellaceae bacterium]
MSTSKREPLRARLSRLWNRHFLAFLFFLVVSAAFWLFTVLNETIEHEFEVPLQVTGVPKSVIISTDLPESLRITLRDKASTLLNYQYRGLRPVQIEFSSGENSDGHAVVSSAELAKRVRAALPSGTAAVSIRPETVEYFYFQGKPKRVPVRLDQTLRTESTSYLSEIRILPDSVWVYAETAQLDTITAARIAPLNTGVIMDSLVCMAPLQPIRGAKFEPREVLLKLQADRLTEKSVQIPVRQVNFPAGKHLRTFPRQVTVTFRTGAKIYRNLTAEKFVITVSYEELMAAPDNKIKLKLKSLPHGAGHIRIVPDEVEFIIEDVSEE